MARRGYPPEFRRRVVDLVEGGRKVVEIAAELGIDEQTIYTWRRQARIDAGSEAGVTTSEKAELAAAKWGIRELETELAIHRRATELLKEQTLPKDLRGDHLDRRGESSRRRRMPSARRLGIRVLRMAESISFAEIAPPRLAHRAHHARTSFVECMRSSSSATESPCAERPWGD